MDGAAIREIFREIDGVRTRRMFGGQGIYSGALMFGLEAGGDLYLKVDEETREEFVARGLRPFTYEGRGGRSITMSYWQLPDSAFDDPEEAAALARRALRVAARAKSGA